MYHDPQTNHNQPPHSQCPPTHYQPNAHNQPWPQPTYPQTPDPQPFPSAPPLLPPKPELNSQWGGDQVLSPLIPPGPPPWMHPSTDPAHRTGSLPASTMSAAPRLGNAIPPEHVRMFDAGKHQAEASMMPTSPQFHLQPGLSSRFTPSPAPHGHNWSPQAFPQMGTMSPQMSNLSPLSPGPPPIISTGDAARARSYSHSHFTAPPPPPPIMNRGHTPIPPPPTHHPHPPTLPHMQSEPQVSTMQQQQTTAQSRHLSLPLYPQAPGTPVPNMLPPAPPTPAPPTHTPAFPMPFASTHAPVHQDANSWIGGIAPRPNAHFRPFQPMPSIPQATHMEQPPPPAHAPPPPPPPVLGLQMPVPMIGTNGAPPLPPPPKHAVTSPATLVHGPWSDGLHRSGTATANKLPLPPKEPPIPPKERASTNELPLPPKVPVASPSTLPSTSTVGNSPTLIASPLVSEGSHSHEEELREALRLSLADSAGVRGSDEDYELQRALEASMREVSLSGSGFVGHYDSPGSSLNARSPVSRRTPPPEQDPVPALKPVPHLPRQGSAPSALERAPGSSIPLATPLPRSTTSSSPVVAVGSAASNQAPLLNAHEDDEPPPPAYEEVTNSATHSPVIINEPAQPLIPVDPSAHNSPGPSFGAAPRSPPNRSESYPRESRSPPRVAEPPLIEIIPPSHNNSLVRREPGQPAAPPVERPHNVAPPAEAPRARSPPTRPELVQRSATASPPAVPRPRTASHARPASEVLLHSEHGGTGLARQRVMSASHANAAPASRLSRASMFFTGKTNPSSTPPTESPHRTWAIDEEPSGSSSGLMLQPPEPANTLLQSRNASKTNLNEVQADAPLADNLLQGVSYGFRDPDPPSPVPMPPAEAFPPSIMIGENTAFHIQGPNFRHLLRLLSHYGSTNIQATPAAIAASKSGEHAARVVLYFIKGNHDRDPWLCRLFLELHTPGANETVPVADTSELWKDSTIQALAGPRGKIYVVPGPLPVLPLSFQGLSTFLVTRLESATRAPSDSSPRRLERILVECYGSVAGAAAAGEEIGGRQKGSGNISFGGLFSKVKDKFSSDKGATLNDHTYDLISPFQIDEYR